ncbi:MAG: creatininase family protein [Longimicrobiales bacterium]|jgi:creatinine amidohydrolase|nr:creatininase family protein [Longimicrobiales bacterium]
MKWHELTSPEIAALVTRDPVAILPIAAIEQHGPHLPLSTDVDIGDGLIDAATRRLENVPFVVLPAQTIGSSPEHVVFPGTLTLSPALLEEALVGLAADLHRAGVRRLVVSNSHGGNKSALDSAALRIRSELDMLVVKSNYFRFPRPAAASLPESEWLHGLHGGAVETAMMLHLRHDLVRTDAIQPFESLGEELEKTLTWIRPEGVAPFAWMAQDLNPHGVTGDATLATAELGARLVEHYAAILADVIRDAHAFPVERLETAEPPG